MDAHSLISQWSGKIPADSVYTLQEEIKSLSQEKIATLYSLSLKNKFIGLVLGLFLGGLGVDRFYKGDKRLGVYKLTLMCVYIVVLSIGGALGSQVIAGFGGILGLVVTIWAITDLFLVWRGIPKDNLTKIRQAILGY
ncbi:TM2 domain-containing protein [Helicobacter sp.]|uniref:NINE protein n=1 Tax=Helicobacter sp. TaxID=218 RepID=UPI0019CBE7F9|nr:TM2 domain-containing protein [Helicobacter sp.]MBD5164438.1 TM2 domain-containing protein [Helicobacter sp.]